MKHKIKKLLFSLMLGGIASSVITTPAAAYWHSYSSYYGYHHHYHDYYGHHRYYYNGGDQLAAGLLVGGLVGVMAGSAMTNTQPSYVQNNYYQAPVCYKEKAWSRRFCDENGCFIKTAWHTVCD